MSSIAFLCGYDVMGVRVVCNLYAFRMILVRADAW